MGMLKRGNGGMGECLRGVVCIIFSILWCNCYGDLLLCCVEGVKVVILGYCE
jgi:hypothetical protein